MLRTILGLFRKPEQPKDIKVPAGYRLVPEIPSDEHVESMCRRFDHSHEYKHNFPLEESDEMFRARRDFNRRVVRQIYEEATGQGFHWINASSSEVRTAGSVAGEAYQVIGSITCQLEENGQVLKALDYFAAIANGREPGYPILPLADPDWTDVRKRASSCAVPGEAHDWVKENNSLVFCRKCCSIVANNPPVEGAE